MKTITLRFLLSEPLKVQRLTRAGQSVTVTDNGSPICVIRPADGKDSAGFFRNPLRGEVFVEHAAFTKKPRLG